MENPNERDEMKELDAPVDHDFLFKGKQVLMEKQNHDWDLNEWKWDRDLFVAERLNIGTPSSIPEDPNPARLLRADGQMTAERRRKLSVLNVDGFEEGCASLSLNLGGDVPHVSTSSAALREDGIYEDKTGKKVKSQPGALNTPVCQVDGCNVNLHAVRDYHRRHRVCEMHAKSKTVLVGGQCQRFCQQCSRFHLLQEFDEEKRSCRRRLAGHNRRRRKNTMNSGIPSHAWKDDQASKCIILCLLKMVANLHSTKSEISKDQDILLQLLRMLSSPRVISEPEVLSELASLLAKTSTEICTARTPIIIPNGSIDARIPEIPVVTSSNAAAPSSVKPADVARLCQAHVSFPINSPPNDVSATVPPRDTNALCQSRNGPTNYQTDASYLIPSMGSRVQDLIRPKINDFDLNSSYNDCQEREDGSDILLQNAWKFPHIGHSDFPSWPNQDVLLTCTANCSGSSESTSEKSNSSSGEDVQCCTDRIIFKLFGKEPSDLPHSLRTKILSWLSQSPTNIESHIRPGCVVLTIYLRLSKDAWKELCYNLKSSLKRLFELSDDKFWTAGWICAKVGHQLAFIYNGEVLLDTRLPMSQDSPFIFSVAPIAVSLIEQEAIFTVKGWNLARTTTKLLCSFHGRVIVHDTVIDAEDSDVSSSDSFENLDGDNKESEIISFDFSSSKTTGRGFIELEDHGLGSGFFPFIVAEHDICSELRTLEKIEPTSNEMNSRNQTMEFLLEFGWLLERWNLITRPEVRTLQCSSFSCVRFKWLLEFSIDHDWCAVVRKILDIVFDGRVGEPGASFDELLSAVCPLHRAVRKKCRSMVEFLLKYTPGETDAVLGNRKMQSGKQVFKPSMKGSAGITPLHIAASIEGAGDVLNLLTDDPKKEWLLTWEKGYDEAGFTPENYAQQRGFQCYIDLIQRKKTNQSAAKHLILDMPMPKGTSDKRRHPALNLDGRNKERLMCRACERMSIYRSRRSFLNYRPVILSMVAIATVCVCVGLLLKSPPEVLFVAPFRWELVRYGYI